MAKAICVKCGKGVGGLINAYGVRCTNPACGKTYCYDCAAGLLTKKCLSCGNKAKQISWI
jgi:hypothetical protein